MGIDASTNTLAFCIIENDKAVSWGEIRFSGADVFERLNSARQVISGLGTVFDCDYVAIEASVMVRSASVGIKLAYVYGAIISELMRGGAKVVEVYPIAWQSYIGNKNLTKTEKFKITNDNPGKSASWYKAYGRNLRKQRTMDWAKDTFGVKVDSDNVGDAFGLAYYAAHHLTEKR